MDVLRTSLKASLGVVEGYTDEVETLLKHATYGLSALETLVDELETAVKHGTYGLSALQTLLAAIPTTMRGTDSAALASVLGALDTAAATGAVSDVKLAMAYLKQLVTTLITVAADVANVDGSSIPTMVGTNNAALASVLGALNSAAATGAVSDAKVAMAYLKQLVTQNVSLMMFASAMEDIIVIPGTGADLDFPSVVVAGLPTDCNILRVDMALVIGGLFDTSAAENQIKTGTTDQLFVKLSTDAWTGGAGVVDKCLDFTALSLQVDADAYRGGCVLYGATDIKAVIDANGTYNFRSEETNKTKGVEATGGPIELLHVTTVVRVWFN